MGQNNEHNCVVIEQWKEYVTHASTLLFRPMMLVLKSRPWAMKYSSATRVSNLCCNGFAIANYLCEELTTVCIVFLDGQHVACQYFGLVCRQSCSAPT